ncbi:hypothetical protein SLEP1_g54402 [Rubroshorea leprosula]|uniref:Uncharacterized protein n=1 Tax=Rubroshorea leprosula TaxID=152421 RepID=A0AAV5MFB1_9ROSI|nr:hypothetical protein SLEP1_g54402 [Rubroshorea leprosula]
MKLKSLLDRSFTIMQTKVNIFSDPFLLRYSMKSSLHNQIINDTSFVRHQHKIDRF